MLNIIKKQSPNFDERPENTEIDMIVLHYTGMKTANAALERMCDKQAKVSAHYMIDKNGVIFNLVDEKYRAWHAGVSYWRGREGLNAFSIGIEIVNKGHEFGYEPFPPEQMQSVINLCKDILSRHKIPKHNIVGHSDIAPDRKTDPGELFDWELLAQHNIGLWVNPKKEKPSINATLSDHKKTIESIGYNTSSNLMIEKSLIAFRRHFMQNYQLDAKLDNKTFLRLLEISSLIENN